MMRVFLMVLVVLGLDGAGAEEPPKSPLHALLDRRDAAFDALESAVSGHKKHTYESSSAETLLRGVNAILTSMELEPLLVFGLNVKESCVVVGGEIHDLYHFYHMIREHLYTETDTQKHAITVISDLLASVRGFANLDAVASKTIEKDNIELRHEELANVRLRKQVGELSAQVARLHADGQSRDAELEEKDSALVRATTELAALRALKVDSNSEHSRRDKNAAQKIASLEAKIEMQKAQIKSLQARHAKELEGAALLTKMEQERHQMELAKQKQEAKKADDGCYSLFGVRVCK